MITSLMRFTQIGCVLGLVDGLAFTGFFHSAHDTLALIFLIPSIPCYATVMAFPWPSATPEWLPWIAGIGVMGLVGGCVGAAVHWSMSMIQVPANGKHRTTRS